jgi:hypothetical protein
MRYMLATLFLALLSVKSAGASCLTGDCNRTGSGFALCSLALEKLPTTDACVVGHAAYFVAYVDGVFDSLIERKLACPSAEAGRDQGRAAVKKYLKENPERWRLHIYDLTRDALLRAFPCSANSSLR